MKMNDLEELEKQIVIGERAMNSRNKLLVELSEQGEGKTTLLRRLNAVREELDAPPVTLGAVYLAIRRFHERKELRRG
jgi:ABC-type cobalamin/Fe3+-siderophores transport system ATPase subunit